MGGKHDLGPLGSTDLVGTQIPPNSIVEYLGRGARQASEPGVTEAAEKIPHRDAESLGPLPDFQGGESVDMHIREAGFDPFDHAGVEVAGELRMNTALESDLGRPPLPGFLGEPDDSLQRNQIRLLSEIEAARALGERAEAAAEVALIRVVDIAVDHIGDCFAHLLSSQFVGGVGHGINLIPPGAEESFYFVAARWMAGESAFEDGPQLPGSRQPLQSVAVHPSGIRPLGRESARRHRNRKSLAGSPLVTGSDYSGAVDLGEPGRKHFRGEVISHFIDGPTRGKSIALDQVVGKKRISQISDQFSWWRWPAG
jgi:hypothetical protein